MEHTFLSPTHRLGFGCMRLPMNGEAVNLEEFTKMVDAYMARGFNYFDTAHVYLAGQSETALRECLTARYPRDSYILTDKLSGSCFQCQADIAPLLDKQLESCGVSYFDIYLMHSQSAESYRKFQQNHAYETALELKKAGKFRHFGISFHDTADVLEQILTDHPEIELVQLQLNYIDWEDPAVQSRRCYEVCRKYGKPVLVMEPVKGGHLATLPPAAEKVLSDLQGGSPASYALRFAAGHPGIAMVLSGMSTTDQMEDNLGCMEHCQPLTDAETKAIEQVAEIIRSQKLIPCTACRYCVAGCPKNISIPDLFACLNAKKAYQDWSSEYYYHHAHTVHHGKASDCIGCGKCERICPQHLNIRQLLKDVAATFEGN